MEGLPVNSPKEVKEIFRDFMKRRAGLIKALTTGIFLFILLN